MSASYEVITLRMAKEPFVNYSYLIVDNDSNKAAVIDPSWECNKITELLDERNLTLESILLTHSHHDHVNLVDTLTDRYRPEVYMGRTEIDYYQFRCDRLHPLSDLDVVRLGELPIRCLFTPGHTAGGVCYWLPGRLFTGDTVFIEGCGICSSPGAEVRDLFRSVQRIKTLVNPATLIYPGHSYDKPPGYPLSYLMDFNIYFQLEEEQFVTFRNRKNVPGIFEFK